MIQSLLAPLSVVRIPVNWCHPIIQKRHKQNRFPSRNRPSRIWKFLLPVLLLLKLSQLPMVYAIPGTQQALINSPSASKTLQHSHIDSIVNSFTASSNHFASTGHSTAPPTSQSPDSAIKDGNLKDQPCLFVADTDSTISCIDTGASHFITNNLKSMNDVHLSDKNIRGVGGKEALVKATGTKIYKLKSDSGIIDTIRVRGVCYVPTSPYDLVPPQVLIAKSNKKGTSLSMQNTMTQNMSSHTEKTKNRSRQIAP